MDDKELSLGQVEFKVPAEYWRAEIQPEVQVWMSEVVEED